MVGAGLYWDPKKLKHRKVIVPHKVELEWDYMKDKVCIIARKGELKVRVCMTFEELEELIENGQVTDELGITRCEIVPLGEVTVLCIRRHDIYMNSYEADLLIRDLIDLLDGWRYYKSLTRRR